MSYSNTVSKTKFSVNDVIDSAFRRCRIKHQQITAEMHKEARDELYLMLSSFANRKAPSWCIERLVMDLYLEEGQVELPQGTVDVLNVLYMVSSTNTEIPLGAVNRDIYSAFPDKTFSGRPVNYWFQRDLEKPVLNIWPIPDSDATNNKLVIWRHRHIMDVGAQQDDLEIPQRWLDAIVFGLAARMAWRLSEVDMSIIPMLEAKATEITNLAWDGDNDGSSTFIQPYISPYTA